MSCADVPAQRPLVPDLRRGHQFRRLRQQPELLLHHRVPHHLGQRRRRPDLEPAVHFLDPAQRLDLAQVHHHARPLRPVLQPVERIQPPGHHPGLRAVTIQQVQRFIDARWLEQLERRHHVANHGHSLLLRRLNLVI